MKIFKTFRGQQYPVVSFYDDRSTLNKERILGFLYLGNTKNRKFLNATYTVYLPLVDPVKSESNCGICPIKKECYVTGYMFSTYYKWRKSYLKGDILHIDIKKDADFLEMFGFNLLRMGMFGDPASVPFEITQSFIDVFGKANTIGYTHQWQHQNYDKRYNIMLSSTEKKLPNNKRARIIPSKKDKRPEEIICPNQINPNITCDQCRLCTLDKDINIAFISHGVSKQSLNNKLLEE